VLDCLRKADIPEGHGSLLGNGDVYYRVMFVKKDVHGQNFWGWATKARIDSWGSGDALSKYIAANGSAPRQVPPRSPSPSVGETGGSPAEEKRKLLHLLQKSQSSAQQTEKKITLLLFLSSMILPVQLTLCLLKTFLRMRAPAPNKVLLFPFGFLCAIFFLATPFSSWKSGRKGRPSRKTLSHLLPPASQACCLTSSSFTTMCAPRLTPKGRISSKWLFPSS